MKSGLDRIKEAIGSVYEREFHRVPEQVAAIQLCGEHRRFAINRMGSTGSTWLARLLNSHPDVSATHEFIISRVFPRRSYDSDDIVELIRLMATDTMHGAYLAAGDVGSVWPPHSCALRGKFVSALLVRHPARILSTRLRVYPHDQSFSGVLNWTPPFIREVWDIDIDGLCPLNQIFVQDLAIFAAQVHLLDKVDLVLRIEGLQDVECCLESLRTLTGVGYPMRLIARAIGQRVNERSGSRVAIRELLAAFSPQQRDWYRTILSDVAPLFDYDLDHDAAPRSYSRSASFSVGA